MCIIWAKPSRKAIIHFALASSWIEKDRRVSGVECVVLRYVVKHIVRLHIANHRERIYIIAGCNNLCSITRNIEHMDAHFRQFVDRLFICTPFIWHSVLVHFMPSSAVVFKSIRIIQWFSWGCSSWHVCQPISFSLNFSSFLFFVLFLILFFCLFLSFACSLTQFV